MTTRKFKERRTTPAPMLSRDPPEARSANARRRGKARVRAGRWKVSHFNWTSRVKQANFDQGFTTSRAKSRKTALGFIKNQKMAS